MQNFDKGNVLYLEEIDVDAQGNINLPGKTMVMFQGNFCHYCTEAKPAYSNLADAYTNKGWVFATIQVDGSDSEKKASEKAKQQVKSRGVPTFAIYNNGKFVSLYEGARDAQSMAKHLESM